MVINTILQPFWLPWLLLIFIKGTKFVDMDTFLQPFGCHGYYSLILIKGTRFVGERPVDTFVAVVTSQLCVLFHSGGNRQDHEDEEEDDQRRPPD